MGSRCALPMSRLSAFVSRPLSVIVASSIATITLIAAPPVAHAAAPPAVHPQHTAKHIAHPPILKNSTARPAASTPSCSGAVPCGYIPCDVWNAYYLGTPTSSSQDGAGQLIAIIDPYDLPSVAQDLHAFDTTFGLPDPTSFSKYQPAGPPKAPDSPSWLVEIALDVEWAHAIAPGAAIALVEATSDAFDDLLTAVDYAVTTLQADVVSMSFGVLESQLDRATEQSWDRHFPAANWAGKHIAYFAATGDSGPQLNYPAVSPNVVAVGGTSVSPAAVGGDSASVSHTSCLNTNPGVNQTNETGWSGGTGGSSSFEPKPAYQAAHPDVPGSTRSVPDVAAIADPTTGVAVYDQGRWENTQIGGTSLATPVWAGIAARLDRTRGANLAGAAWVYGTGGLNDVLPGGYDQVTGLGSPAKPAPPADPPAPTTYTSYFTWYDLASPGMRADNIHVVNPNAGSVTVSVAMDTQTLNTTIPGGGEWYGSFPYPSIGGPVVITASGGRVIASQRVQYYDSFNEIAAQTADQAATDLYFPWYDHASPGMFNDNIHLVNPTGSDQQVTVSVAGRTTTVQVKAHGFSYIGFDSTAIGGPVHVQASGAGVLASQRVEYYQSFNETWGRSAAGADQVLFFNWADHASPGMSNDNVHLVNPATTATNFTAAVYDPNHPGTALWSTSSWVGAGGTTYVSVPPGVIGGPVVVHADGPLLASQRVEYYASFNEVPGRSAADAAAVQYMPWADHASPGMLNDNVHVLDPFQVATGGYVTVGPPQGGGPLPFSGSGGSEVYVSIPSQMIGGPVIVVTSGQAVLVSQRVQYYQSFNEAPASP